MAYILALGGPCGPPRACVGRTTPGVACLSQRPAQPTTLRHSHWDGLRARHNPRRRKPVRQGETGQASRMAYILASAARLAPVHANAASHKRLWEAALRVSGRRDSNSQPSAWEADALPLSYARACGRESTTALGSIKTLLVEPAPGLFGPSPAVAEAVAGVEPGLLAEPLPRLAQEAPRVGAEGVAFLPVMGVHFDPPLPTTSLIDTLVALSAVRNSSPWRIRRRGRLAPCSRDGGRASLKHERHEHRRRRAAPSGPGPR